MVFGERFKLFICIISQYNPNVFFYLKIKVKLFKYTEV
ncbi:hypothetical protein CUZ97_2541 [Enterococcus faecium]|nr:hypothetical protein [Enterococcus faecium]